MESMGARMGGGLFMLTPHSDFIHDSPNVIAFCTTHSYVVGLIYIIHVRYTKTQATSKLSRNAVTIFSAYARRADYGI